MGKEEIYEKMAEIFEYPGSQNLIKYLKVLFKPEEGELLLEFLEPATCEEVAKRLKMDEKDLAGKLADFKRRRLLFEKNGRYLFHLAMHGFFARIAAARDEDIPEGFWKAWDDFMPEIEQKMITRRIQVGKQVPGLGRSIMIPAWLAITSNPGIKPEDILPEEDIHEMLRRKGSKEVIAVRDCDCRRRAQRCDRPTLNCFEFGKYAEFNLRQSSRLKVVTVEEAIAISDEAERGGLLKSNGLSVERPGGVLCHCCECCCNVMGAYIRTGNAQEVYAPSRYRPRVDEGLCIGCQTCVERCFFGAIEMKKVSGSKKLKASINEEKCMGCGLCVVGCKQKALIFELVRPPEYILKQAQTMPHHLYSEKPPVWLSFVSAP